MHTTLSTTMTDPKNSTPATVSSLDGSFQSRVHTWVLACFGQAVADDRQERSRRFLEEALEAVQATGFSATDAHRMVDYVYSRPVGELPQEVGGVMMTLAALCLAHGLDMNALGEAELTRVTQEIDQVRARQAEKAAREQAVAPELTGCDAARISRPAQVDAKEFPAGTLVSTVIEAAQAFHAHERSPEAAAARDSMFRRLGAGIRRIEDLPDN